MGADAGQAFAPEGGRFFRKTFDQQRMGCVDVILVDGNGLQRLFSGVSSRRAESSFNRAAYSTLYDDNFTGPLSAEVERRVVRSHFYDRLDRRRERCAACQFGSDREDQ